MKGNSTCGGCAYHPAPWQIHSDKGSKKAIIHTWCCLVWFKMCISKRISHLGICNPNKSYNEGIINKNSAWMVPICESLTHSAAACSWNAFQFNTSPDVTHDVHGFQHTLLRPEAHSERERYNGSWVWPRSIRAGSRRHQHIVKTCPIESLGFVLNSCLR